MLKIIFISYIQKNSHIMEKWWEKKHDIINCRLHKKFKNEYFDGETQFLF